MSGKPKREAGLRRVFSRRWRWSSFSSTKTEASEAARCLTKEWRMRAIWWAVALMASGVACWALIRRKK